MKKFAFPLRSIATVRNLREMQAREAFSRTVQAFVAAEQKVLAQQTRLTELGDILRSGRLDRFRAADQSTFMAAFRDEQAALAQVEKGMREAKAEMEKAREEWMNARRDVRVIENLEAKARRAHARELESETQNAMDDRACAMAMRTLSTVS